MVETERRSGLSSVLHKAHYGALILATGFLAVESCRRDSTIKELKQRPDVEVPYSALREAQSLQFDLDQDLRRLHGSVLDTNGNFDRKEVQKVRDRMEKLQRAVNKITPSGEVGHNK